MFIKHFEVTNYLVHRSTALQLHPVTVLVGSNNAGKSALFDSILNFSMVSRGKLSQAFGLGPYSFQSVRHRGVSAAARIGYRVQLSRLPEDEESVVYSVSYSQRRGSVDPPQYVIHDERLERLDTHVMLFDRADPDACAMHGVVAHLGEDRSLFAAIRRAQIAGDYTETDPLVTHIAREISRINKFRLAPTNLARPSRLPDTSVEEPEEGLAPRIDYYGEELAAVLYYLAEISSPVLTNIVARLRCIVSGFEGFEFNTVGTDRIGFSVQFSDERGVVPAALLSDGTLSLIGTLTLLMNPTRPPILFLEEPESGLTPRSTRAVYETIVEVASPAADPRTQVVISSHSPFVIVEAWNGDERDFIYRAKVEDGRAVIRPLNEVVNREQLHLKKVDGKRRSLSLRTADEIMDGYYS